MQSSVGSKANIKSDAKLCLCPLLRWRAYFRCFFWATFCWSETPNFRPVSVALGLLKGWKAENLFLSRNQDFWSIGTLDWTIYLWELPMKANLNIHDIDPSIVVYTHGFCQFHWILLPFTWGLDRTGTGQGGRFIAGVHSGGAKLAKVGHALDTKMQQKISPWDFCLRPSLTLPPLNRISSRWGSRPVDVLEVYVLVGRLWIGIKGTVTAELGASKVHGNSGANSRGGRKVDERRKRKLVSITYL